MILMCPIHQKGEKCQIESAPLWEARFRNRRNFERPGTAFPTKPAQPY